MKLLNVDDSADWATGGYHLHGRAGNSVGLFFDFTNGFHDTANAMATPIATGGAIKPKTAVALAAVLNLVGAFLSTEVAKTISGGLIREGSDGIHITPDIIFAGSWGGPSSGT